MHFPLWQMVAQTLQFPAVRLSQSPLLGNEYNVLHYLIAIIIPPITIFLLAVLWNNESFIKDML